MDEQIDMKYQKKREKDIKDYSQATMLCLKIKSLGRPA